MTILQFQPIRSQPTPEFWTSLAALKLDKLGLDDSVVPIHGWVEEGREFRSSSLHDPVGSAAVGMDGSLILPATAFDAPGAKLVMNEHLC